MDGSVTVEKLALWTLGGADGLPLEKLMGSWFLLLSLCLTLEFSQ